MSLQTMVKKHVLAEAPRPRQRAFLPRKHILRGRPYPTTSYTGVGHVVRITNDLASRATSLGELGIAGDSNQRVSLNEFTYKKGPEIYGEKEPADYVYQVKAGSVRSYKLLRTVAARSARFTSSATSSDWKTETSIGLRQRRS